MAASTAKQWRVTGTSGFQDLKLHDAQIPKPGDHEVLVQWKYASLNYRDLVIAKGQYPFPQKENVVPGSDAAGVVAEVGAKVNALKKGDHVAGIFTQAHHAGPIKAEYMSSALGGATDGVFQEYTVLEEGGLVKIPESLDFQQASTLPCAGVTAWNALYGIEGKKLVAGQWVLTEGTGGVSVFALQFAKAAGARVVATTSSSEKMKQLKQLGADHIINYKETPNWGEEAKKLTGGVGIDHIIEVGGPTTVQQALAAVKPEGVISIIGFVGGQSKDEPSYLNILQSLCTVRGLVVGSRDQFQEMNASIDANNIKPVVDSKSFDLKDLPSAYQYMWDQNHFGKLTVKVA